MDDSSHQPSAKDTDEPQMLHYAPVRVRQTLPIVGFCCVLLGLGSIFVFPLLWRPRADVTTLSGLLFGCGLEWTGAVLGKIAIPRAGTKNEYSFAVLAAWLGGYFAILLTLGAALFVMALP